MDVQPNKVKPDRRPVELWTPWGSVPKFGAWKKRPLAVLPKAIASTQLPVNFTVKPVREA